MKHPTTLLLTLFSLFLTEAAQAQWYCPPKNPPGEFVMSHRGRKPARWKVHPTAAPTLQCVVDQLEQAGYTAYRIYGYACRQLRTSNHPRGLAIDVNQDRRDVTTPRLNRELGKRVARNCNAVSGGAWKNPDNGHFEVRSLSRQQQQQRRRR